MFDNLPTTARALTGFGRTAPSVAQVLSTPDVEVIANVVREAGDPAPSSPAFLRRGILARGL
jgi:decaprenylphospho-beta-D-ribofuranose 2-oxidase